jgi:YebC/PmpR family DNA-binding regulatory protein
MSGHSKWASIKRKKAVVDSKRGKEFSKHAKSIMVAAKHGGGNIDMNANLRLAVEKAKEANMPADNIKKAIMKGAGELPGVAYEEITYEGYGPGGVAILMSIMTDNKNRTISELRHIFSKNGGNMAEAGSVAWMFAKKGYILVKKTVDEDTVMTVALEAGAEDMKNEPDEEHYEIYTSLDSFHTVRESLQKAKLAIEDAEITMIPQSYIELQDKEAEKMIKLYELLDDHDDVQNVYTNFDVSDKTD